ncbi:hypothetical protein [Anaerobaca lacustris]|uniref:DUF4352 domain-containing protein n=1 Tax=Anaerobaca lacustris TaxID=3044600 RepID=A0AAW6TY59_9BACT|nr:hypothetical protein [Sedimentisphaerales bacterium M17dextr]
MNRCLVYGTVLALAAGVCLAAPEPAVVQRPGQWTVEVKFEQPEQLVLPWGGNGPARFWYMILTVTNRTGQDVGFYPRCELMSDTFQVVPAGVGVPPIAFETIKQRHQSRYPFLEALGAVENRILQGQDNAKDIVVVWPDFDNEAASFKVFITGLSNETAWIDHPVAVDNAGQPVKVFLRKTLVLDYAFRGDPALRNSVQVVHKDTSWVMR